MLERNRTEAPPRPRGRVAAYLNDIVLENWALEALSAAGKALPAGDPARSRGSPPALASGGRATDRSDRIFANERRVRFTEMEYGVPREHGPEAARRVIEWVRANRYPVFFPIEMRVAAGDDALLSPSHERDTAYIAVHQYRGMEWRPYFEAVEAIMNDYGGRPHWGKRHFQTAETLAPRYPRWAEFQAARDELDPGRVFTNEYARAPGPRPLSLNSSSARGRSGPRRGRWGPRRRSRRPRPGGGSRSARRARPPWRGACRRGRRSAARRPAAPSSGVCTSPAPSSGSSSRPGGSQGEGRRAGVAAARGEVAAAERGRHAAAPACGRSAARSRRPGSARSGCSGRRGRARRSPSRRSTSVTASSAAVSSRLPVPPPLTIGSSANSRIAATIAARRSASSAAERRCMKRIAAPRRRRPGGRSPTPAIWPS